MAHERLGGIRSPADAVRAGKDEVLDRAIQFATTGHWAGVLRQAVTDPDELVPS